MSERWPDGHRGAVTITFDGGYVSSFEHALPLLAERGLPSTWFLVAGALGTELEGRAVAPSDAWIGTDPALVEIGNHSWSHPRVRRSAREIVARAGRAPSAIARGARRAVGGGDRDVPGSGAVRLRDAADDFATGKQHLERLLGRPVPAFAYPNGGARGHLVRAVDGMGHESARTSEPGWNVPRRIHRFGLRSQTWTTATEDAPARGWLDRAVREDTWLIETFHVVDDGRDFPWTTTPAQLAEHLDAIIGAGVWVATQSAVVDHLDEQHQAATGRR